MRMDIDTFVEIAGSSPCVTAGCLCLGKCTRVRAYRDFRYAELFVGQAGKANAVVDPRQPAPI